MTSPAAGPGRDREEVDEEFARMMRREGLASPAPVQARGPAHDPLVDEEDPDPAQIAAAEAPSAPLSDRAVLSWAALSVGLALVMLTVLTPTLPRWLALLGGAGAVGGLIALLLLVPRSRSDDDDGARV